MNRELVGILPVGKLLLLIGVASISAQRALKAPVSFAFTVGKTELLLALQAFHWNHLWRIGLSIAAWTIGSCAAAELLGYWLHHLLHSRAIRFLNRNHMKHHLVLYGPLQRLRSGTYRDATDGSMSLGNIGLEWLIPAGFLIAIVVAVFHLLCVSFFYQALSLGSALGWSFLMFSHLHDLMHVEGIWLEKHSWTKC